MKLKELKMKKSKNKEYNSGKEFNSILINEILYNILMFLSCFLIDFNRF